MILPSYPLATTELGGSVLINAEDILESLALTETINVVEVMNIIETIVYSEALTTPGSVYNETISELATLVDVITYYLSITVSESLVLTDTIVGLPELLATITESLLVSGDSSATTVFVNTLQELLTILDTHEAYFYREISDSLIMTDTITQVATFINVLNESLAIAGTVSDQLISLGILEETLDLTGTVSNSAIFSSAISNDFILSVGYGDNQDTFLAYCFSPEGSAITTYSNFNFTTSTKFGSKYLFGNSTGLYEYGANTDNGTNIKADIKTGVLDFGTSNLKQLQSIYLGIDSDSQMYMKVRVDDKAEVLYKLNKKTVGQKTLKVALGKGLIGRYFQFEFITKASELIMSDIEFYQLTFRRKL